jgi:hypothetical protein
VVELLENASEEIGTGKRSCDRRAQAKEFLERFKEVVIKGTSFRSVEASNDCCGEIACDEIALNFSSFFLEPGIGQF